MKLTPQSAYPPGRAHARPGPRLHDAQPVSRAVRANPEWRLWRDGDPALDPVTLSGGSLEAAGSTLAALASLETTLTAFLRWEFYDLFTAGIDAGGDGERGGEPAVTPT
jgi:hypothetical protein